MIAAAREFLAATAIPMEHGRHTSGAHLGGAFANPDASRHGRPVEREGPRHRDDDDRQGSCLAPLRAGRRSAARPDDSPGAGAGRRRDRGHRQRRRGRRSFAGAGNRPARSAPGDDSAGARSSVGADAGRAARPRQDHRDLERQGRRRQVHGRGEPRRGAGEVRASASASWTPTSTGRTSRA